MKASDFESHVGKALQVETQDSRTLRLTLEKIDKKENTGNLKEVDNVRDEPFTLILSGPVDQPVHDQLVDIKLDDEEAKKVFIKPLSQNDDGIRYEVIIN